MEIECSCPKNASPDFTQISPNMVRLSGNACYTWPRFWVGSVFGICLWEERGLYHDSPYPSVPVRFVPYQHCPLPLVFAVFLVLYKLLELR
jgi:hypothetical protein